MAGSAPYLRGERLGDRRIRRGRRRSQVVTVRPLRSQHPRQSSVPVLLAGLALLILLGTALLLVPATRHGESAGPLTAVFTATLAVTVTGLVVHDTDDYWSPFGQTVILGLIQLGGLGYMTCATLILGLMRRQVSLAQRTMTSELIGRMGTTTVQVLVRRIVLTPAVQGVGIVVLAVLFTAHAGRLDPQEVRRAVFTGISAFNNAGEPLIPPTRPAPGPPRLRAASR